ncbi:MAG: hypothetical protein RI967_2134 [Planctomycetota bacterium]
MNRVLTSGAVTASALCLTLSADAGMISATYLGAGASQFQQAGYNNNLAWDSTGSVNMYNLRMSEHRWDVGGKVAYTWCVQMFQGLTGGTNYEFELVEAEMVPQAPPAPGPMGVTKANLMRDAMARWLDADSRVIASAGSANAAAAAFSALVWEISHENLGTTDIDTALMRMSLSTGAFRSNLTGEAATIYGKMIASLGKGGWLWTDAEGWQSPSAQDQIRLVPGPGALALLAIAGARGRRRR